MERLIKMTTICDMKIQIHVALRMVNDFSIQGECDFCHCTF